MTSGFHRNGLSWRHLAICVALLVAAVPAFGQTTYSYQGNNYNAFPVPGPTFDNTMSVSGSFVLTLPLPPNLAYTGIGIPQLTDYSFSNGAFTFTPANSVPCDISVATGPDGSIVQWRIFLRQSPVALGADQFTVVTSRMVGAADSADFVEFMGTDCATGLIPKEQAEVTDAPGVWTSDAMAVPALPEWAWALLLALLALAGATALRSRQRA